MESLPGLITGFLAVLLFTAFVKVMTTLSILRYGLGLTSSGFGLVFFGLSLALACLVMAPQLDPLGGLEAVVKGQIPSERQGLEKVFRPFMEKQTDGDLLRELSGLESRLHGSGAAATAVKEAPAAEPETELKGPAGLSVLVPAFLLSELRDAFQIGFLILVPFLVLDILVANLMLALGVVQIPQAVVTLPLKILLFFAVDGWRLISEKIIGTYLG